MKNFGILPKSTLLSCMFLLITSFAYSADEALRQLAQPWQEEPELLVLLEDVEDRRLYLIGEASHGTREFYRIRGMLSQYLIENDKVQFVLVEGDWNSLQPLNAYVLGLENAPESAAAALDKIGRWPIWMWNNEEIVVFGEWLRQFNQDLPGEERVGIYGMDVYGMWDSLHFLIDFFTEYYPDDLETVKEHYTALLESGGDQSAYIQRAARDMDAATAGPEAVSSLLLEKMRRATAEEQMVLFDAFQQAKVVEAGAAHLRAMTQSRALSWNHRARHFYDTARRLLDLYGPHSAGVVWAHNTHVGDSRATPMARQGQVNIGQLARADLGEENVHIIGFGTGTGTVKAARQWETPGQIMTIPDPVSDSLEAILLNIGGGQPLWMRFDDESHEVRQLRQTILPHRAIGVLYQPEQEHMGNFVPSILPLRYDAFIFLPTTESL